MGIITGYICLISFMVLALKFVARKAKFNRVNRFLQIIHKPVSCIFFATGVLHFIIVLPVLKGRNIFVTISGIIALAFAIVLVVLCHTIKNGQKKMHWHRMMTVLILMLLVVHVIVYYVDFIRYLNAVSGIEISDVNVNEIPDGEYTGKYDVGYIYAKVKVTVADGKISDIEILEHRNERGGKAESIIEDILEEQRIDVDAVTGATNSSLVIKKACENALSGIKEDTP